MAKRFTVEFTEHIHRNITVRADTEAEATDWVESNWEEACAQDSEPLVDCRVDHCYEAEYDGSEDA